MFAMFVMKELFMCIYFFEIVVWLLLKVFCLHIHGFHFFSIYLSVQVILHRDFKQKRVFLLIYSIQSFLK